MVFGDLPGTLGTLGTLNFLQKKVAGLFDNTNILRQKKYRFMTSCSANMS